MQIFLWIRILRNHVTIYELVEYDKFSQWKICRKRIYRKQSTKSLQWTSVISFPGTASKFEKKIREILTLPSNVLYWVFRCRSLRVTREKIVTYHFSSDLFNVAGTFSQKGWIKERERERQLGIIAHSFAFTTIENHTRAHIRSGRVNAQTRSIVGILHAGNLHKASLKRRHKDEGRKEMPIDLSQPTLFFAGSSEYS